MKSVVTVREELKVQLDEIRSEYPEVARNIWELFKEMKTPEKVVEKVVVKDDQKEQELSVKVQSLESQLVSKKFHVAQLKQEVDSINNKWEERFTVYFEDTIDHFYLKKSDEELRVMHRGLTEKITEALPFRNNLTFAQKQILLHLGFSEFHLLKTLSDPTGVEGGCFPVKIKKRL